MLERRNTALDQTHFHLLHVRVCGRDGGVTGLEMGEEEGEGVMGRAAVHPFALYPQSKHDKWGPSLA